MIMWCCRMMRRKEIAKEIVRNDALDRVILGLDYFDASINRIAAWTVGMRNMQKALLSALLTPWKTLKEMQDQSRFTELMLQQEELKTYPLGAVLDYFCEMMGVPVREDWYKECSVMKRKCWQPENRTIEWRHRKRSAGKCSGGLFSCEKSAKTPRRKTFHSVGK